MSKNKINILVCTSILFSVYSAAAPLNKYYIPQQSASYTTQTTKPNIEKEFRSKVANLSPKERKELEESFQKKMNNAVKNKNFEAAEYYQRLIAILNSFNRN